VQRYQIVGSEITSEKAGELLGNSLEDDSVLMAFRASDELAARGLTVIPVRGSAGDRVARQGVRDFMAEYAVTDSEIAEFSPKFPPAEVQLELLVDGYNTSSVERGVRRARIHKAWITLRDNRGRKVEGIGVEVVDEVADWQREQVRRADARQAMLNAVGCAVAIYLGEESKLCQ
jgi:hypothetical protein